MGENSERGSTVSRPGCIGGGMRFPLIATCLTDDLTSNLYFFGRCLGTVLIITEGFGISVYTLQTVLARVVVIAGRVAN
jgi:hypothetical protein